MFGDRSEILINGEKYISIGKIVHDTHEEFFSQINSIVKSHQDITSLLENLKLFPLGFQLDFLRYIYFFDNDINMNYNIFKSNKAEQIFNSYYGENTSLFLKGIEFWHLDEDDGWEIKNQENNLNSTKYVFNNGSEVVAKDQDLDLNMSRFIPAKNIGIFENDLKTLYNLLFQNLNFNI